MPKLTIKARYATIPNDLLNNADVSLKAKGLYGFIQSKPDDWNFSAERIALQTKDGKDSVKVALQELEAVGYLTRNKYQDNKGYWQIEYILTDTPEVGNSYGGKSNVGNSNVGKPANNSKQELSKKDYSKQEIVKADAEDEIASLYFQVIKKYELPTRNFNNVRSAIDKLKAETSHEQAVSYLTFLLEKYQDINFDFKPELTEALDIHAKRMQIITAVKRTAQKHKKAGVLVI